MDQVRGAIFSSLAERVVGARVLDLFAGTGGLGIEALSRGAIRATFVERDRQAVECIRENLAKTRLAAGAEVVGVDVFTFCQRQRDRVPLPAYDLIFADPPYLTKEQPVDHALRLLTDAGPSGLLAPDGIFVLEKTPLSPLGDALAGWQVIRQKRYGISEVVFLTRHTGTVEPTASPA